MIGDAVWLLAVEPWIALGQVFGAFLACVAVLGAGVYGVDWWMRVDDPERER